MAVHLQMYLPNWLDWVAPTYVGPRPCLVSSRHLPTSAASHCKNHQRKRHGLRLSLWVQQVIYYTFPGSRKRHSNNCHDKAKRLWGSRLELVSPRCGNMRIQPIRQQQAYLLEPCCLVVQACPVPKLRRGFGVDSAVWRNAINDRVQATQTDRFMT